VKFSDCRLIFPFCFSVNSTDPSFLRGFGRCGKGIKEQENFAFWSFSKVLANEKTKRKTADLSAQQKRWTVLK